MAVTSSQNNGDGVLRYANGAYIEDDTAAAFTITTGFQPRRVRVTNLTSRDQMEWFEGMTAAHGLKTVAAGTRSAVTSNGITVSENGFTVGLDTDVNVADEQLYWEAWG